MSQELLLMLHPTFGILGLIAAVWVFVETLNVTDGNHARIIGASKLVTVLMWLAYIVGGYWYVVHYGSDKALIKAGPWSFSHSFFMETKEHVFLMLILLATFLPIAASGDMVGRAATRTLVLWSSALIVLMTLAMEGAGAFISMGVKAALLAN